MIKKLLIFVSTFFCLYLQAMDSVTHKVNWCNLPLDIQNNITKQSEDFKNFSKNLIETIGKPEKWNNKHEIYDYSRDFILKYRKNIKIDGNSIIYWEENFDSDGDSDDIEIVANTNVAPNKLAVWGSASHLDIFASFEDGTIYKITGPRQFTILHHWKAHNGAVVDIEPVEDKLISVGEDGLLFLWDNNGQKLSQWAFEDYRESNSVYIKYLKQLNVILIQNAFGDYLYFYFKNNELKLFRRIDYQDIEKLSLRPNIILTCNPDLILEMIKLQKGIYFKKLATLRSLSLAITKNRTYYLHEKEKNSLSENFSLILDYLHEQKYIGEESRTNKFIHDTIGKSATGESMISTVNALTKIPWGTIGNEVLKFGINFMKGYDSD